MSDLLQVAETTIAELRSAIRMLLHEPGKMNEMAARVAADISFKVSEDLIKEIRRPVEPTPASSSWTIGRTSQRGESLLQIGDPGSPNSRSVQLPTEVVQRIIRCVQRCDTDPTMKPTKLSRRQQYARELFTQAAKVIPRDWTMRRRAVQILVNSETCRSTLHAGIVVRRMIEQGYLETNEHNDVRKKES